jgi:hypothetical protein
VLDAVDAGDGRAFQDVDRPPCTWRHCGARSASRWSCRGDWPGCIPPIRTAGSRRRAKRAGKRRLILKSCEKSFVLEGRMPDRRRMVEDMR